jgi:hypothetical protein
MEWLKCARFLLMFDRTAIYAHAAVEIALED